MRIEIGPTNQGILEGEFRYIPLPKPVPLSGGTHFILSMSTTTGDGDHFHDDVSYDGLSPLVNPKVKIIRSLMFKDSRPIKAQSIPSFADLTSDYSSHRLPVGPTLKFK
jgi:hypothetical protein